VLRAAGQASAAANQERAADDTASGTRDRVIASKARDQRAGGGQPAGDTRALRLTGHPLGAGDQLCQPAPIARRPRRARRPQRM
jgi:hypothetical protein